MWHTPEGDKLIDGTYKRLLQKAIAFMCEDILTDAEINGDDEYEEPMISGVHVFDKMNGKQALYYLAYVASMLFESKLDAELNYLTEATIAAIHNYISNSITCEIEMGEGDDWRKLTLDAIDWFGEDAPSPLGTDKWDDTDEWARLADILSENILWDADWELADEVLDLHPDNRQEFYDKMGVEDDYFMTIPPEISKEEVDKAVSTIRRLTKDRNQNMKRKQSKCSCGWPKFVVKAEVENLKLSNGVVSADVKIVHACRRCKKIAKSTTTHGECQIEPIDATNLSVQVIRRDKIIMYSRDGNYIKYRICFAIVSTCSHGYTKECYRGLFKVSEREKHGTF
jgi:hypothetical protein